MSTPVELAERVSHNIKMLLADHHRTREDLVRNLGISMSTYHMKMRGERRWHLDEIEAIAAYFDAPISRLLDARKWSDTTPPAQPREQDINLSLEAAAA